jgi:hypothetical protein
MLRCIVAAVGLLAALPAAVAGEMTADEARQFVIGTTFNYACFEGTRGQGRVNSDGSVTGSIRQGSGPVRYAQLPANTLQVRGGSVCASLRGLPFQPCFNLERTSDVGFRGSISGLGFAYCEFTRHRAQTVLAHSAHRSNRAQPLGLRPSLAADKD